jgi:pimeloyl-ACP methyl ester carboxylesterase
MTNYTSAMAAAAAAAGLQPPRIVQPTDHFVTRNGVRLHYLDWGNAHLPPLLLLHGGRLQAHTWDMAALLLRDHYHIIALDQRGHGDSDWTPAATLGTDTFDLMLEDTRQFIEYLDFEQLALVGMSMGGINTIRYASRHPQRLRAVAIVDVAPESMNEGMVTMNQFDVATETLVAFEDFVQRSHQFMPHRPIEQLRYSLMHSLKQLPDGRWTWKQDHRAGAIARSPEVLARNGGNGWFYDLWDDLPRIRVPALLLRGAQSKILAPDVAERAAAALPRGELVTIDPATHNVHSDNPGAFAAALHEFLQRTAG